MDKQVNEEFAVGQVKYIIDIYGYKMMKKIIREPGEMYVLLGTTKFKFDREVKTYIYSKYPIGEMKSEIDKKVNNNEIENITKIEVISSSTCNIVENEDGLSKNEKIKE